MATIKKYNGSTWENAVVRKYGTASEIITSPTTIYADGTAITAYTLKGNEEHTGTPSPQNPVMPNGVGERTINIVDWNTWISSIVSINGNGSYTATSTSISITSGTSTDAYTTPYGASNPATYRLSVKPNTTYSVSIDGTGSYQLILWKNGTTGSGYGQYFNSGRKFGTITTDSETTFYTVRAANTGSLGSTATLSNVMIVEGEYTAQTMPAYEPYGYKIPISTLQGSVVNYLGSVQSTRQIQKLVLDGTETGWTKSSTYQGSFYARILTNCRKPEDGDDKIYAYCTHAEYINRINVTNYVYGKCGIDGDQSWSALNINLFIGEAAWSVDDFKAYLAQQYASGTPVTVWYVLKDEQTGIVNEPLMKIGTYADSISNATAIPTTEGANSITVDTTVQPSEFTATWAGWHDAEVKEKSENMFNAFISGIAINTDTGAEVPSSSGFTSDFIAVDDNSIYSYSGANNTISTCFFAYDSSKAYIGRSVNVAISATSLKTVTSASSGYTVFANSLTGNTNPIAYIRVCHLSGTQAAVDSETIMLNSGSTALPYESYWK